MRFMVLLSLMLLVCPGGAPAKIYKWIDENGTVHFSDKPVSRDAEVVDIRKTGIQVEGLPDPPAVNAADKSPETEPTVAQQKGPRPISEADYRISSSVGKLGGDVIGISGRISAGPRCEELVVTATAVNDNGLRATVTDRVKKSNSFGSTIFEGNAKVFGSAEDRGFWKVEEVKITCSSE